MMTMRTINAARNPRWADADHSIMNIDVDFDELDEEFVPFTTTADADTVHGLILWGNAIAGDYGLIAEYVAPPPAPITLYPADLWLRTTEAEAEQIEQAMATQPAKLRNIFLSSAHFRSDDPLWDTLVAVATTLFGEDRAQELLAPSAL